MPAFASVFLAATCSILQSPNGSGRAIFDAPRGLGEINDACRQKGPFLSCDGLTLYFHSDRSRCRDSSVADIWKSTRRDESAPFGTPELVMPNGADPCVSCDELALYFVRPATEFAGTSLDLWVATRTSTDAPFGNSHPVTEVNSSDDELGPRLSHDALDLYFASSRPGGQGDLDLWVAHRDAVGQPFHEPTNVVELNSPANETNAAIAHDGLSIVFGSARSGGHGSVDLYRSTRPSTDDVWGPPQNLDVLNSADIDKAPALSGDGRTILFRSGRPGGKGLSDIYIARDAISGMVDSVNEEFVDVLEANGSAGDSTRHLSVAPGEPISLTLAASPAGPDAPQYALFAFLGEPLGRAFVIPHGVGSLAMPVPSPSAISDATRVWVNAFAAGRGGRLGRGAFPNRAAPGEVLRVPQGLRPGQTVTIQGVMDDVGSVSRLHVSTTNALTLVAGQN
ncbi:MAG: PD40 domain-containing protein [Planctomycetes bacterium]|nr:PD40 domain-containing protein [Planctomycetota bacterium]MBI3846236.1 PD40 domain-containing protein [Planctomycetota bacterium]